MTYAETLRAAMVDRRLGVRTLSQTVGRSYEHIRKLAMGDPVVSRSLNKALCEVLHLSESEMWAKARKEKALARYGADSLAGVLDSQGQAFFALWGRLERRDRAILTRVAEGLAGVRRRERRKKPGA